MGELIRSHWKDMLYILALATIFLEFCMYTKFVNVRFLFFKNFIKINSYKFHKNIIILFCAIFFFAGVYSLFVFFKTYLHYGFVSKLIVYFLGICAAFYFMIKLMGVKYKNVDGIFLVKGDIYSPKFGKFLWRKQDECVISMGYRNYENRSDRDMCKMFLKSVELLFNQNVFEEFEVNKVIISTHDSLTKAIIKKLSDKNNATWDIKNYEKALINEIIEIDGINVTIKPLKKQKNLLFLSRIPFSASNEKKKEVLEKVNYNEIKIPVELFNLKLK